MDHPRKRLLRLGTPLMVRSLAGFAMFCVDRFFLSLYSVESFNAVVYASNFTWAILYGTETLADIALVYVAYASGANRKEDIGQYIWQMIWFSLATVPVFLWISFYLLGGDQRTDPFTEDIRTYSRVVLLFGPFYPLYSAVSAFFIGQGRNTIIVVLSIIGNLVNILLDRIFIFGYDFGGGFIIPANGVPGAALATSFGIVLQAAVTAYYCFRPQNIEPYQLLRWRWNPALFFTSVKTGLPNGLNTAFYLLGWALFYHLVEQLGHDQFYVAGICQTGIILMIFFGDGLSRAATVLTGRVLGQITLGQKNISHIYTIVRAGLEVNTAFIAFVSLLVWLVYPLGTEVLQKDIMSQIACRYILYYAAVFSVIYLYLDNIKWLFIGVLVAMRDTLYIYVTGKTGIVFLLLLPTYYFVNKNYTVEYLFGVSCFYSLIMALLYGFRFLQKIRQLDPTRE